MAKGIDDELVPKILDICLDEFMQHATYLESMTHKPWSVNIPFFTKAEEKYNRIFDLIKVISGHIKELKHKSYEDKEHCVDFTKAMVSRTIIFCNTSFWLRSSELLTLLQLLLTSKCISGV